MLKTLPLDKQLKTPATISMKTKVFLAFVLAFAGYCAASRAQTISSASWWSANTGTVACSSWTYDDPSLPTPNLTMAGTQYSAPGEMVGTVTTSGGDPTLYLGSAVNNDTSFAWTSYQVNVYMAVPFTFYGTPNVSSPFSDWSFAVIAPTYQPGGEFPAEPYEGTIDLTSGTPIAIGDELGFSYAISFSSSTDYAFTQEMIPVPEPGDLGLVSGLLFGGFQLVKRLRKKA
jgi:hypothetical protein